MTHRFSFGQPRPEPDFDFLTFEEADRLLETAKHEPGWHAIIFTAVRTGLRYGELCELRWHDVDLTAGRLLVRRSFTRGHVTTPKNHKKREIPLSPAAIDVLKRHRQLKHLKDGLVFCKPDGGRRLNRRADVAIKKFCRLAGLRLTCFQVCRHTFASHLVMRGRSLKEVQELLGHSDFKQTMRYAHLAPSVKREAVTALDGPHGTNTSQNENARLDRLQPGDSTG